MRIRFTLAALFAAMLLLCLVLAAFRAAPGFTILALGLASLIVVPAGLLLLGEWLLGPVFFFGPRYQRNLPKKAEKSADKRPE